MFYWPLIPPPLPLPCLLRLDLGGGWWLRRLHRDGVPVPCYAVDRRDGTGPGWLMCVPPACVSRRDRWSVAASHAN